MIADAFQAIGVFCIVMVIGVLIYVRFFFKDLP